MGRKLRVDHTRARGSPATATKYLMFFLVAIVHGVRAEHEPVVHPPTSTMPSRSPSARPSASPSITPSVAPTTKEPTRKPTHMPSNHPTPVPSTPPTSGCFDGIKNGKETGLDCGGGACDRCKDGKACNQDMDCVSLHCSAQNMCEASSNLSVVVFVCLLLLGLLGRWDRWVQLAPTRARGCLCSRLCLGGRRCLA